MQVSHETVRRTSIIRSSGASTQLLSDHPNTFGYQGSGLAAPMAFDTGIRQAGTFRNVLRMVPPLCLSGDDVQPVLDALDRSFADVEKQRSKH